MNIEAFGRRDALKEYLWLNVKRTWYLLLKPKVDLDHLLFGRDPFHISLSGFCSPSLLSHLKRVCLKEYKEGPITAFPLNQTLIWIKLKIECKFLKINKFPTTKINNIKQNWKIHNLPNQNLKFQSQNLSQQN